MLEWYDHPNAVKLQKVTFSGRVQTFCHPLVCIEKVGWQQWERVIIWQAGSDTAPRQSDETGVKKQNGRSKRFDSRYLSEACLKRLVKNLSKRLDQQQLLVRSLVTLTVKEWVRSQMYTLFWGFCKINNPFGKSGKNMKNLLFNADVYLSFRSQSLLHIGSCDIFPSCVWSLLWSCQLLSTSWVVLKRAQNWEQLPHSTWPHHGQGKIIWQK